MMTAPKKPATKPAAAAAGATPEPEPQSKGATADQVKAALAGALHAGPATAKAIAAELAGIDFAATPEDEAAAAIQAAIETVTEAKDKETGGAAVGHGARLNHGQAILVARAIRAATS
jgi:hypothetical protein